MADTLEKTDKLPRRLCSEIQLFDLCDLDSCLQKSGRFCNDAGLLVQFEKSAEKELRIPECSINEEYGEDDEAGSGDDYDEECFGDDENDDWEEDQ